MGQTNDSILAAAHLNVDSTLYLLRALGIESVPLTLELHANVYYSHEQALVDGVIAPKLVEAKFIDSNGNIDPALARWLRVLERPDITACAISRTGTHVRRVVVARQGRDHVMALRVGDEVVVQSIWSRERSVDNLVAAPLWDALRLSEKNMDPSPAEMKSITWEYTKDDLRNQSNDIPEEIRKALSTPGPTAKVLKELMTSDGQRCEIMIQQEWNLKSVYAPSAVLLADTKFGRVVLGTRKERSHMITTIGAGTYARFRTAINDLIAMAPSRDWFAMGAVASPNNSDATGGQPSLKGTMGMR